MVKDTVISLLPDETYEVEVDIYEEDIVKVKISDPVKISLVAFPDKIFKGKVIEIDPAEKLIEGVVYYEVTIGFEETPENIKPGMTADIAIQTARKENVLLIPKESLQEKDDKTIVQVFENGEIKEKEIETGLLGDEVVEIISGLNEGEKVIIK